MELYSGTDDADVAHQCCLQATCPISKDDDGCNEKLFDQLKGRKDHDGAALSPKLADLH